ncbi:MAG: Gfo/Idh/MocA family oxidoreductase [Acidimicrobiales bacterium]
MSGTIEPLGLAVIGAGYWGPNLVRNAVTNPATELRWICDLDLPRAQGLASTYAGVSATGDLRAVLDDPCVEAVAIATPASSHAAIAIEAVKAGKHVVIEKPIASSGADAADILRTAEAAGRVVMCDHTYCYTPAVQYIREALASGELGELQFIDSVRINLGLVQRDIDVVWDLAPHDLSIIDAIIPAGEAVHSVSATGADPVGAGQACVAYLSLQLASGAIAHVHVNWLSPTKVRTMIVGGSRRTLVWDDLHPSQRISVFDRGVEISSAEDQDADTQRRIAYRIGDMVAPALQEREALASMFDEFVAAVRENRQPLTDGHAGLRVLHLLEAARRSMADGGRSVLLEEANS